MIRWLLKKYTNHHIHKLHQALKTSFTNVQNDMSNITQWINHFQKQHQIYQNELRTLSTKIDNLNEKFDTLVQTRIKETKTPTDPSQTTWDQLTDLQQQLAWVLLGLDRERPDQWYTLRDLAEEFYQNKEYKKVRTTIIDYTRLLEEFGFIEKKRTSSGTFIRIRKKDLPPARTEKSFPHTIKKQKATN